MPHVLSVSPIQQTLSGVSSSAGKGKGVDSQGVSISDLHGSAVEEETSGDSSYTAAEVSGWGRKQSIVVQAAMLGVSLSSFSASSALKVPTFGWNKAQRYHWEPAFWKRQAPASNQQHCWVKMCFEGPHSQGPLFWLL